MAVWVWVFGIKVRYITTPRFRVSVLYFLAIAVHENNVLTYELDITRSFNLSASDGPGPGFLLLFSYFDKSRHPTLSSEPDVIYSRDSLADIGSKLVRTEY